MLVHRNWQGGWGAASVRASQGCPVLHPASSSWDLAGFSRKMYLSKGKIQSKQLGVRKKVKNKSVSTKIRKKKIKGRSFPRQQNRLLSSPQRWRSGADIYTAACSGSCAGNILWWIFLAGTEAHGESMLVLACPKGLQPKLEQEKKQQRTVMDWSHFPSPSK